MEKILYCSESSRPYFNQIIENLEGAESYNTLNINNTHLKDLSKSSGAICIELNTTSELVQLLESKRINSFNLPFIFILKESNKELIQMLFQNHQTNIFYKDQPTHLLCHFVEYLFSNYQKFVELKNVKLLSKIDEKKFTKKEFQIVSLLANSPLHKTHKDNIHEKIWGVSRLSTNTLDVHICNLRRKLEEYGIRILSLDAGIIGLEDLHLHKEISL